MPLTGNVIVDAVERALFAFILAYCAAHAHRWTWFVSGGLIAVPAQGPALLLALGCLAVATGSSSMKRRSKTIGAIVGALIANAPLWYQSRVPGAFAAACVLVAFAVVVASGAGEMRRRRRRLVIWPVVSAVVLVLLGIGGTAGGGAAAAGDLTAGTSAARAALKSVERGDTDAAKSSLSDAQDHLGKARSLLGPSTLPARLVPSLAQQVRAVHVAIDQATKITDAADDLLATTDYDKLRYNGRLDLEQIAGLAPGARTVHAVLTNAEADLEDVRSTWLVPPLRDRIDEFHDEVSDVREASSLAGDMLEVAPGLFGADGTRHYLVVFLTPAELRGAGGFIGNYAELEADNGKVELSRSGPIRELIQARRFGTRTITGPADFLRRYGRFQPQDYIQDVTLSPNFPAVGDVLAQLYPQSGGRKVDGVIAVDPTGLAALLKLTGPVRVDGLDEMLSSTNAEDLLIRDQYLVDQANSQRKEVLEAATRATFKKLTKSSLPAPRTLGAVLGPAARGRHLQVWSPVAAEQDLFRRVNADSALHIPAGNDGFSVTQQNSGNNKIDGYLQREIDYRASVNPKTGHVDATLTVTLHNNVPSIDLPRDVVGNARGAPVGTNVAWLNVFTPHQVTKATFDGQPLDLSQGEREAGLNAYDTPFLEIPPGGTGVAIFTLSGGVDLSNGYHLTVLPQPVANRDVLKATIATTSRSLQGPSTTDGDVLFSGQLVQPLHLKAALK
ncbi:MAG: DUF4012 domain-containing protein, partial [Aquihabitans sp.]